MLDATACYRAILARDSRFDGLFFVGVSSTGIYCRPVCPARKPKPRRCTYFSTAAAAEREGYRPCLRCRPELAPHRSAYDDRHATVAGIVGRIQAGCLNGDGTVDELARGFGLSPRQLRRLVKDATGVAPIEIAQTARLLLAKQLLTDTALPVTRVAFASGFSSLRRFNETFLTQYGMAPTRFRRAAGSSSSRATLSLRLTYRPPLAWSELLAALASRSIGGVEEIFPEGYRRTARLGDNVGWLEVRRAEREPALVACVSASLAPALQPALARLRELFDLHARPDLIATHLATSRRLGGNLTPGLRVPGAFEGFELAWRVILEQRRSARNAASLAARFASVFGDPVDTPYAGLTRLTPEPQRVAAASVRRLAQIGLSNACATAVRAVAILCRDEPTVLCPGTPVELARERLGSIPGVGPRAVETIAMHALHWPDAFPEPPRDGITGPTTATDRWRPWRAYAAMHLRTRRSEVCP